MVQSHLPAPSRNPLGSVVAVALMVAIAVSVFLYGVKFGGNITGFFRIGSELPLSPFLNPETAKIYQGELGYDGQQFLTIALDPGLTNPDSIAALDHPAYRYRRIFYPLLGYLFGLGQPALIPWALVGINILAIAVTVGLLGWEWGKRGKPWLALGSLTIPGVWMILSLSTADLLASAFTIGAIISYRENRWNLLGLTLALGLLTRETVMVVALGLILQAIREKQYPAIARMGASILPLVGWLGFIQLRQLPGSAGTGNFSWPLVGIAQKFQELIQNGFTAANLYEAYNWCLLLITLAFVLLWTFGKPSGQSLENILRYPALLYAGLFSVASLYILTYYLNYNRVFLDLFYFATLLSPKTAWTFLNQWGLWIILTAYGLAAIAFLALQS